METRRLGRIKEFTGRVKIGLLTGSEWIANGLSMEVAEGDGAEAAEKKKTAVFLTVIGAHTYQTVRNWCPQTSHRN